MWHGLQNTVLYTAYRFEPVFANAADHRVSFSGTGFFVTNAIGVPCFVTNRHLVEPNFKRKDTKYVGYKIISARVIGKRDLAEKGDAKVDHEFLIDTTRMFLPDNPAVDIACLPAMLVNVDGTPHKELLAYWMQYAHVAGPEFFESLTVCDVVAFPGYPEGYDKENDRPVIRMGTIASDSRFDYHHDPDLSGEFVLYEAFSFPGSPGSPVYALPKGLKEVGPYKSPEFRDFALIGINAGHIVDPRLGHGALSWFYKSTEILRLVDRVTSS